MVVVALLRCRTNWMPITKSLGKLTGTRENSWPIPKVKHKRPKNEQIKCRTRPCVNCEISKDRHGPEHGYEGLPSSLAQFFSVDIDARCSFPNITKLVNSTSLAPRKGSPISYGLKHLVDSSLGEGAAHCQNDTAAALRLSSMASCLSLRQGHTLSTQSRTMPPGCTLMVSWSWSTKVAQWTEKVWWKIVLDKFILQVRYTRGTNPKFNSEELTLF